MATDTTGPKILSTGPEGRAEARRLLAASPRHTRIALTTWAGFDLMSFALALMDHLDTLEALR